MSRELRERFDSDPDDLTDRELAVLNLTIGVLMADALADGFAALSAKVDAAVTAETAGAQELADLTNIIKGFTPGTALTADQINAAAAKIDAATTALSGQTSASATATDPAPPAPAVDPATGQPPVDPATGQPIPPA